MIKMKSSPFLHADKSAARHQSVFGVKQSRAGRAVRSVRCESTSRQGGSENIHQDSTNIKTEYGTLHVVSAPDATTDQFGEPTAGSLHIKEKTGKGITSRLGLDRIDEVLDMPFSSLKLAQQGILGQMGLPQSTYPEGLPTRAIFCSRTLSLKSIEAVGYDMDYTLIHYDVNAWERRAYEYGLGYLRSEGIPVEGLSFDPSLVIRGLIVDKENGNVLKVDRFGFIKRASHGTRPMTPQDIKNKYKRELVSLRNEARFEFLNTLFSVSEAVLYMQMVDKLDQGEIISTEITQYNYKALWKKVGQALYHAHVESRLKAEIIKDPSLYVEIDEKMAQTLIDQRTAGKKLVLITNSDLAYTNAMMSFAYDRFMPANQTWRDLFEMVIVQARKPNFFSNDMSMYEVVDFEKGLMRPCTSMTKNGVYCGGTARMVETALGLSGDQILYVGDHIYTDAALAKINLSWRTCLIVRELEEEIMALAVGRQHRKKLKDLLNKKELIEFMQNQLRLTRKHRVEPETRLTPRHRQSVQTHPAQPAIYRESMADIESAMASLSLLVEQLDGVIEPMLAEDGAHFNERWGYLSRSGLNDKSQFTRQIEKYADIYTSRVSNFQRYTPFMYFRSPSQPLAHDRPRVSPGTDASWPKPLDGQEPGVADSTSSWEASTWEEDDNLAPTPPPKTHPASGSPASAHHPPRSLYERDRNYSLLI